MENLKSPLLYELHARGFIYQTTDLDGLDELLNKEKISIYVGFDCTAKSLHVGSLMQIMILRKLQQSGHKPIILLGSATTRVGDPSDKHGLRKILSDEEIEENKQSISQVFHKFLDFSDDCPNRAEIVDNIEWLGGIKYLDFLREYGMHFSINRMLTFDSVKNRLEKQTQLTFLEFNYMLLQAYDFLHLYKTHNCRLQFGGSEQWGNIVSGIELGRRVVGAELFGITTPLITTSNGIKMGKTAGGAVWLNADMLSPYDYWQFWRNTSDVDVLKFIQLYTELPIEEINSYKNLSGKDLNELKKKLADEATAMCHGAEAAGAARQAAEESFEAGISDNLLTIALGSSEIPLYKAIVDCSLAKSSSEARKLITGKGVKLDTILIEDEQYNLRLSDKPIKLSVGKKKHVLLRV
jgi:tyrosyl-tRNA synthetase